MAIRGTTVKPDVDHVNFTGINNVDDGVDIGPRALKSCTDYDNRKDGMLVTRPGQTVITSQSAHSMWSNKDKTLCLYRAGANLVRLNADESSTVIASGFQGSRMICRDGAAGEVYVTDGQVIGRITNSVYEDLSSVLPMDHFKNSPIAGISIEFWRGILFIIVGNKAFFSDPFMLQFDLVHNVIPFAGPVTLFRGVASGIWVADGKIKFLSGNNPVAGMTVVPKADYNAISGSDVLVPAEVVKGKSVGRDLFFLSERGVCIGSDDGYFVNATEKTLSATFGKAGAGLFRHDLKYNRYIAVSQV